MLIARCDSQRGLVASLCAVLPWSEDGPPEWIQLLPIGPEVIGRDGRAWRLEDADALVAAFRAEGVDLPLDWEHATELKAPKGELAPAAGFIKELDVVRDASAGRAPGIWGRVDWNQGGASSVRSREYRYVSPVFAHTAEGAIKRLLSAGLTNRPNLDLFALNHQQSAPTKTKENDVNEEQLKRLRARLGLAADASAEAVELAMNARIDEAARTNVGMVPKTDLEAALNRANVAEGELKKLRDEAHERAVNAFIEKGKAEGKIAPASEPFYRSLCATADGLANTQKHYETLPVIVAPGSQSQESAPKTAAGDVTLTAEEKARCQRLGIDEKVALTVKREEAARGY